MRRGIAAMSVLLMVLGAGLWQAKSAAAEPVPWTWVQASASGVSTQGGNAVTATCPAGYVAVSGGVTGAGRAYIDYMTYSGRYFSVLVYGSDDTRFDVTTWCAESDQVAVTRVDRTLTTSHSQDDVALGLGDFACDGDETPLGASLSWNSGGYYIAQSGPESINGVNEWFVVASGLSTSASLDVRLLCVPNSDLAGATWVTNSAKNTTDNDYSSETAASSCPAQQRMLTGGEHIDSILGAFITSTPVDGQTWTTTAVVPKGDTLTTYVLCAPDGDPVANFIDPPYPLTRSTSMTVAFDAVDPAGGTAQNTCFVNTNYMGICNGSYTATDLPEGENVIAIEAVTPDGRGGGSTEKDFRFWVDRTPPTVTMKTPPRFTLGKTVTLQATGSDDHSFDHYEFAVTASTAAGSAASSADPTTRTYTNTTGTLSVPVIPGVSYRASVTAFDQAGNASVDSGSYALTASPVDNVALAASRQWTLIKGNAYTHGLVSRTKAYGATLRKTMYGDDLGLVATTCKSCGTVGVYVDKVLIKSVNLHAAKTYHQQVIKLPVNGNPITMNVIIKVLSHHKLVEIDGLGAVVN